MNIFDNEFIVRILGFLIVWDGVDIILYPKWESNKFLMTIDMTPIKWSLGFLLVFLYYIEVLAKDKLTPNRGQVITMGLGV